MNQVAAMNHYNQPLNQKQLQHPQSPRVARPASVLLEPSSSREVSNDRSSMGRPRSQSHTVYSNHLPSAAASTHTNSGLEPAQDNPVRFQQWRQPTNKSKLSKQYVPSEEDSDNESSVMAASDVKRRSKFMSGAALELNSNGGEGLQDLSRMSISQMHPRSATPSVSEGTDSGSIKSAKKKISLGKRISKFFTGNNSGGNGKASNSSDSQLTYSAGGQARSSTTSLAPIDELTPPGRIHSVYIHQRSHSTPDQIGHTTRDNRSSSGSIKSQSSSMAMDAAPLQNPKLEESRLRKARDSGFEDVEGKEGGASGRRRYSSANGTVSAKPLQQLQQQQLHHLHAQQPRRSTHGMPPSSSSPQLHPHSNHRQSPMGAELLNSPSPLSLNAAAPTMPRRSSTPVPVTETLISKVDREKASVCFQQPSAKKGAYVRDTNLDPALSSLLQQHRKDFKTNQRLGGTPQPQYTSSMPGGGSPRMRASMQMEEQQSMMMMSRDPNMRRDSSGSQHLPLPFSDPSASRRLSTSSQNLQSHPYSSAAGQRANFSGSQGSLNHYPQQQQHSPMLGAQRTSPQRQSSSGYFTGLTPQQQHQYQLSAQPHVSPIPSPSLGSHPTANAAGVISDMSLQQHQQLEQLQQIRMQQQQFLLQQQQQLQQQMQQTHAATPQAQVGLGLGVLPTTPVMAGVPTFGIPVNMGLGMGVGFVNPGPVSPLVLAPAGQQSPHVQQVTYATTALPVYATAGYQ
ncbi:hypothetical protein BGZ51_001309 [Haplosporangium sp. Z 767]|nr:hypothetical protein BGZ51_001309 [Haplosporangium sp. Z 767]KAF9196689.1 hypothetical protein BGZ50_007853 [Haplosporangium sp. Z 11]